MSYRFSISFPITVEFGNGVSKIVGNSADKKGWKNALIITDKGIINAGLINNVIESLNSKGIKYDLFDEVKANPTDEIVFKALEKVDKKDFIIAIGGGSSIDVAKVVAVITKNGGKPQDYEIRKPEDLYEERIKNHPLPLIAIPTTAGTGSEVDFWAVITDTNRKFKMSLGQLPLYPGAPYLGANLALLDPELTLTLPPSQTASTGIDALFHAIETFTSKGNHPLVEALAPYVIRLIFENLTIAYKNGRNLKARERMLLASSLAGICENYANCGLMHALGEPLGALYDNLPHGICLAVFSPHVMEFNLDQIIYKYSIIAQSMGEDIKNLGGEEAARSAIKAIKRLIIDLGLPRSLKELKVRREDLNEIVKRAYSTLYIPDNPKPISQSDLYEIVNKAYEGF
ncbi:MAG: iron-containing alcohol dehydrogenase [Nitrososphaerales archaeon]